MFCILYVHVNLTDIYGRLCMSRVRKCFVCVGMVTKCVRITGRDSVLPSARASLHQFHVQTQNIARHNITVHLHKNVNVD